MKRTLLGMATSIFLLKLVREYAIFLWLLTPIGQGESLWERMIDNRN